MIPHQKWKFGQNNRKIGIKPSILLISIKQIDSILGVIHLRILIFLIDRSIQSIFKSTGN